ncbi:MAG TPA: methyltransferase domain-containing protein [Xanthobacteraceae bacterium]|nr:methyltransferase domain-containing protein [Xanthobacteraceae bacterium]
MSSLQQASATVNSPEQLRRRVLNAGSGPLSARQLHPVFRENQWRQIRLDIDPQTNPDVVGSITNMTGLLPSEKFDAIWSSHSLEHLYAHEVPLALSEFRRILRPDGFALITSPDLEAIARVLLEQGLNHVAYTSPMGPITPHDMIFGHSGSIARGKSYMAHNTGFTCAVLGQLLLDAGFPVVLAKSERFDLWALAFMEKADKAAIQGELKIAGLDMFDDAERAASALCR